MTLLGWQVLLLELQQRRNREEMEMKTIDMEIKPLVLMDMVDLNIISQRINTSNLILRGLDKLYLKYLRIQIIKRKTIMMNHMLPNLKALIQLLRNTIGTLVIRQILLLVMAVHRSRGPATQLRNDEQVNFMNF